MSRKIVSSYDLYQPLLLLFFKLKTRNNIPQNKIHSNWIITVGVKPPLYIIMFPINYIYIIDASVPYFLHINMFLKTVL